MDSLGAKKTGPEFTINKWQSPLRSVEKVKLVVSPMPNSATSIDLEGLVRLQQLEAISLGVFGCPKTDAALQPCTLSIVTVEVRPADSHHSEMIQAVQNIRGPVRAHSGTRPRCSARWA